MPTVTFTDRTLAAKALELLTTGGGTVAILPGRTYALSTQQYKVLEQAGALPTIQTGTAGRAQTTKREKPPTAPRSS